MQTLWEILENLESIKQTVLCTVSEGEHAGEKLLLCGEKPVWYTENTTFLLQHVSQLQGCRKSGLLTVEGQKVFTEPLGSTPHMVICGAGHVSMPVIQMAKMLGFTVTVIEDRPYFADMARRAKADQVLCVPFAEGLDTVQGNTDTYFVVVTRGHRHDQICLENIMKKDYAYVGMMGSRRRVAVVKEELLAQGIEKEKVDGLHAPIGLSIAAETPEEIAVSILAEVIEEKNKNRRSQGFNKELLNAIADTEKLPSDKVLATIISRRGSAPRAVGTKMLVCADGQCIDTIGGGCMEAEVRNRALRLMKHPEKKTEVCEVDMTAMDAEEEGMVCGGRIEVLLEKV